MLLRFHAKGDALQRVPDFNPVVGQADRYVGREQDPANPQAFPASEKPFECDSESVNGQRLKHLAYRDREIWPADEATAEYCQVPFVELERIDGEWVAKQRHAPAQAPAHDVAHPVSGFAPKPAKKD